MSKLPQARGGIEKKFLTSIIWVGVIPVFLAVSIGYFFAQEAQWNAVKQNLEQSAQDKAQGVHLAIQGRLEMTHRVAQDVVVVSSLAQYADRGKAGLTAALEHLSRKSFSSGAISSNYALHDAQGQYLGGTQADGVTLKPLSPALLEISDTTLVDFDFFPHENRYAIMVIAPVKAKSTDKILGYMIETQSVDTLLRFLLGGQDLSSDTADQNHYEIIHLTKDGRGESYYLSDEEENGEFRLVCSDLDEDVYGWLRAHPDDHQGSNFEWRYESKRESRSVWYSYCSMNIPDAHLYVFAYRPTSEILASINIGALLTILVSVLVIGIFCVIGYRIVNNNIIRPVSLLNEGAQIIRQGDLDLKLKIGTGDEIEELASSFNQMATALRHNIRQLGESEENYRSLINSMRDGIYQTDRDSEITFINPAGAAILGFSEAGHAHGTSLRELFIEQIDYTRVMTELERRGFVERSRVWMRKTDERSICVELSANRMFSELGNYAGLEGTFRDVTQHVRLEQEVRNRAERISAINQITNAINSSLEAGRLYESIVAEVRKLVRFDYAAVSLVLEQPGDRYETFQLFPETDPLVKVMEGGESCAAWVVRERKCLIVDHLKKQDFTFTFHFPESIVSCLCVPLYTTGKIIGTMILGSNKEAEFTRHEVAVLEQMAPHVAVAIRNAQLLDNLQHSLEEVTLAREKLHEANEELKTLDEMKTNLLSNVSHELRTPLVAVMGYTDMILNAKAGPVNEVQKEYLGISLRNIEKLVTLIENLLDFSRLHRGAEELVFDTLDLVDCAKTSMQIVQPVADSRQIKLVIEAPEDNVLVEGDKGKLGQVFNNLLSNAVKFNDNGGEVRVDIQLSDANAEITVSDTGIGIPEEALDKIFTRFYQYDASSTRKYGGTGIGLSIAQDIMRLHGSRITVSSEVGKGTTFRFVLPLSGQQIRKKTSTSTALPLPTETHLLVEIVTQDRALSAQVRNLLLSEGMDVIHAAYPAVAVTLAEKYNPDCVLVDTEAGPLGSVVVEEVLNSAMAAATPILLLTNDESLYEQYKPHLAGRVRRGFRKSTLLSGIHYALSRGVDKGEHLGDKVLCVDDDPEIGRFIQRCLQGEGYEVDWVKTGEEALVRVESKDYWLALLDVAMPGINGWETCEAIKSEASLSGMKVYMVTAKPVDKSIMTVHASGADGYLMKPFKAEDLITIVQSLRETRENPVE